MNTHRFPPEPRENDFLTYTAVITRKQKQVLNRKCQVCDNFAPNHFHYGGICCFACRAFFRRTYVRLQKQKSRKWSCKYEMLCSSGNIRKCMYCRYHRCLLVGMDPKYFVIAKRTASQDSQQKADEYSESLIQYDSWKKLPTDVQSNQYEFYINELFPKDIMRIISDQICDYG